MKGRRQIELDRSSDHSFFGVAAEGVETAAAAVEAIASEDRKARALQREDADSASMVMGQVGGESGLYDSVEGFGGLEEEQQ